MSQCSISTLPTRMADSKVLIVLPSTTICIDYACMPLTALQDSALDLKLGGLNPTRRTYRKDWCTIIIVERRCFYVSYLQYYILYNYVDIR